MRKNIFSNVKTIVVKIGTSVLLDKNGKISRRYLKRVVDEVLVLLGQGKKVILVSSGAVAFGMETLGIHKRPSQNLPKLQACAAAGQGKLMRKFEELFSKRGYHTAQILLTRDGLNERKRYVNSKHTIEMLLKMKVVPIANENDTVSTEEIRFGDNDVLASQIAALVGADLVVMLSDIDGLYYENKGKKKVISFVSKVDQDIRRHLYKKKGDKTMGGMESKLEAAHKLMNAGIPMVIANGKKKDVLSHIVEGVDYGTLFHAGKNKQNSYKNWLAFSAEAKGDIQVDDGAKEALQSSGRSLLSVGLRKITGKFQAGDVVSVSDLKGKVFAKGIVNLSRTQIKQKLLELKQKKNPKNKSNEIVHRDNLIILK